MFPESVDEDPSNWNDEGIDEIDAEPTHPLEDIHEQLK